MKLRAFCDVLEKLAPTRYAAKWDNVGLLVEPAECHVSKLGIKNGLAHTRASGKKLKSLFQFLLQGAVDQ